MKKILLIFFVSLILFLIGLFIRTLTYPFTRVKKSEVAPMPPAVNDSIVARIAGGIKIAAISIGDSTLFNHAPFEELNNYIRYNFPLIYRSLETYTINGHALVFRLKGSDKSLLPLLFLSHMDVVPPGSAAIKNNGSSLFRPSDQAIPPVSEIAEEWDYAPFSGAVANGRIYGRGSLDMKGMLFSLLEATEQLVREQVQPKRDIYLAFGFDEEVGGVRGAAKIADYFKEKGLKFEAVYDEGGLILEKGSVEGISSDVALIGCAEKGFLSLKIKVKGLGGHSSMPPTTSAIGQAAVIMQRLENHQMKAQINPIIQNFFQQVGGSMPFASRFAIANRWLLEPLLLAQLTKNHSTNALVRTTTALTMMKGSDAPNVLSPEVEFVVNFRLLPENTLQEVRDHVEQATSGFDVEIEQVDNAREASKVSPTDAKAYKMMEIAIRRLYPDLIITPYLTVGGTDAIKYQHLSDHIYRFMPIKINHAEQQSMHSTNEYISIENYLKMIDYFYYMMRHYDDETI
ncbi:M20/M25/M40 family metallo-hydrolase [Sphingobacterium sp. 40-24]|uniref:M20/M25/M40 family metallo-hydrolase n=1 Tax=Sphingobacterium sp. 40-24 TaxID=1895843 RepID=UPI000959D3CD|nr:M20/M25/M40 family metallo-hydrolase [Sphingobacterium sp. 40-24]OJZ11365.1 MAG: peptidase [Sphingobacterium sp. 40-24]